LHTEDGSGKEGKKQRLLLKMISDYFRLAVGNLFHRKLRSWLTVLGIFIGIAAVVALISLSQGMNDAISNIFSGLGSDRVLVMPKGMFGPPGTASSQAILTQKDLDVIKKINGVKEADGQLSRILPSQFAGQTKYPIVTGIPTDQGLSVFTSISQFDVVEGRMLKGGDKFKAVVGYELTKTTGGTFKKPVLVGKTISIDGQDFDVVGVRKALGSALFDTQIIVPRDALREITGIQDELSVIEAIGNQGASLDDIASSIKKDLRRSRNLKEGNEDFQVQTPEQLMQTVNSILGIIQAIIIGIAGISLVVGGIGIMNTMYTAVLERTNEIGTMKAIGAKNSDILTIFLVESGLLGLIGGGIGVAAGMLLSKGVEIGTEIAFNSVLIRASFPWWLILGALAFSFVIGTLSGIVPAYQASRMEPVASLRYE